MIGGEFEIDLGSRSERFVPAPDTYYYASGRSALYQILKSLISKRKRVWLPDYLCHTIIETVIKVGYDYSFYELDNNLVATPSALELSGFKSGDIALIINYFGLQDLTPIAMDIKNAFPGAIVIEDDVQAFFSYVEETNPYADYRFTSLRKGLPVPDGGMVYTKKTMPVALQSNSFSRLKLEAGMMKARRGELSVKDAEYLALFEKGEMLIDENYESNMSVDSKHLFAGIDFQKVKMRRKENARFLLNGLRTLGIQLLVPVPEDSVPLFIPILLLNRDKVRRRMFANEVFCPVHWPLPQNCGFKKGSVMAQNELSLIVDQRYGIPDMEFILSLLYKE